MNDESGRLKQYLLGSLSEQETEAIDLRILEDESFSVELSLAESELIEDYLEGSLSDEEFKLFDSNFLTSSERKDQLREISLLKNYARQWNSREKRDKAVGNSFAQFGNFFKMYMRPLMAGALLVTAVVLIGVVWQLYFSGSASPLEKEYAELNKKDLSNVAELSGYSAINLSSGSFRDANSAVKQSAATLTDTVLFRLALPAGSEGLTSIKAKISRPSSLVFTLSDLHTYQNPNGREVRILVPRSILQKGQYQIRLENAANGESPAAYTFSIE